MLSVKRLIYLIHLYYKIYPACLSVNPFKVKYLFTNNYFFFNKKDNLVEHVNYREDLEIKLQKVTLAMQEVVEDINKTNPEKQRIIS